MKKFTVTILTFLPIIAFAQDAIEVTGNNIYRLIEFIGRVISIATPIVVGAALLAFFWGLVLFLWRSREGKVETDSAKDLMLWGLIALFVMISVWGILRFISSTIGLDTGATLNTVPCVPTAANQNCRIR